MPIRIGELPGQTVVALAAPRGAISVGLLPHDTDPPVRGVHAIGQMPQALVVGVEVSCARCGGVTMPLALPAVALIDAAMAPTTVASGCRPPGGGTS